ncbi:hypothetical protein ACKC9G_04375 [Pokkaliibacter sp. CJK22405]|uniref:hypothetical protein n=1 Tax=Pokkaliibacter sp. CJK22405 TaxID=3384615 RepID=UPI00398517B8
MGTIHPPLSRHATQAFSLEGTPRYLKPAFNRQLGYYLGWSPSNSADETPSHHAIALQQELEARLILLSVWRNFHASNRLHQSTSQRSGLLEMDLKVIITGDHQQEWQRAARSLGLDVLPLAIETLNEEIAGLATDEHVIGVIAVDSPECLTGPLKAYLAQHPDTLPLHLDIQSKTLGPLHSITQDKAISSISLRGIQRQSSGMHSSWLAWKDNERAPFFHALSTSAELREGQLIPQYYGLCQRLQAAEKTAKATTELSRDTLVNIEGQTPHRWFRDYLNDLPLVSVLTSDNPQEQVCFALDEYGPVNLRYVRQKMRSRGWSHHALPCSQLTRVQNISLKHMGAQSAQRLFLEDLRDIILYAVRTQDPRASEEDKAISA